MPALISALKNEHTKRILRATRIRPPAGPRGKTPHYRMPVLEAAGGYLVLGRYRGPEIPRREWKDLTYTTYATDPAAFFGVPVVLGKFWSDIPDVRQRGAGVGLADHHRYGLGEDRLPRPTSSWWSCR